MTALASRVADVMTRIHPETQDCIGGWTVAEDHRDGTAVVVWRQGDGTWPATLRGTVMWRWLWALRGDGFTVEPRLDMEVFGRPDEESPDGRARWLHVTAWDAPASSDVHPDAATPSSKEQ